MSKKRGRGYLAMGMIQEAINEKIITIAEVEEDLGFKELITLSANGDRPQGYVAAAKCVLWGITIKKVSEEKVRENLNDLLNLKRRRRREKRR